MPTPVTAWTGLTPVTAKSLDLALYTSDGTADNPTGIASLAYTPLLYESYTATTTLAGASGGTTTVLTTSGSTVSSSLMVLDTAGYYGLTSDLPGKGFYEFTPVIPGTAGDGITPGGWMTLVHYAPVKHVSTQTSVGADLQLAGGTITAGARQAPNATNDSAPFFCDLLNTGSHTYLPCVTLRDSAGSATTNAVNASDPSGETPRFFGWWNAPSATTGGQATFTINGTYSWTAPAGVTQVTATPVAAGSGAGAGNVSGGNTEFGGGGAGAGESATQTIAVTPGNSYPVIVGAAGLGGTSPGGNGAAGGNSSFTGDAAVTVTAHAGAAGTGATTLADGTGGAGGTGSSAPTHHNGGAGANGVTAQYGGGGGSSAGPATAGIAATSAAGAPAPPGGGPGGSGGTQVISVGQMLQGSNNGLPSLTVTFGTALQAGSTVVFSVYVQGSGVSASPVCTLSDGTVLDAQTSGGQTVGGGGDPWQLGVYTAFNVKGGQRSLTVTGAGGAASGGSNRVILCRGWEITGLGSSPNIDVTNQASSSGNSSSFSCSAITTGAPDLWFATVAAQAPPTEGTFAINVTGGNGWIGGGQIDNESHSVYGAMRPVYQTPAGHGTAVYKGTLTKDHQWVTLIVAITAGGPTVGNAPLLPPGGGGGAGFGLNNGGSGIDGQVSLSWTAVTGSGYGTPALPAPYTNWGPATTIGTALTSPTVDINSTAGVTSVVNFLTNKPVLRVAAQTAQSIASAASSPVQVTFSGATPSADSYAGWSAGTYTVPRAGIWLLHGLVCFAANSTGTRQAGASVNGQTWWGPGYKAASSGETYATKTQILSLNAGDTVRLTCRQDSGGSLALSTAAQTRLMLTWLCESGVPAQAWQPPDVTFRWSAGTPGSVTPGQAQTHLGNDLSFLCQPPVLMAWQSLAQSGLAVGSFSTVVLDTVSGIVHSDAGDTYSGWTPGASNLYTAQAAGWYLAAGEVFTSSSAASGATVVAAILPSTSGGGTPLHTPDQYQQLTATSTASVGGGATVLGLHYLLPGETLALQVEALSFSGTYSTLTGTQNAGTFASHLSLVWISE